MERAVQLFKSFIGDHVSSHPEKVFANRVLLARALDRLYEQDSTLLSLDEFLGRRVRDYGKEAYDQGGEGVMFLGPGAPLHSVSAAKQNALVQALYTAWAEREVYPPLTSWLDVEGRWKGCRGLSITRTSFVLQLYQVYQLRFVLVASSYMLLRLPFCFGMLRSYAVARC